jgi:hypothetical protein
MYHSQWFCAAAVRFRSVTIEGANRMKFWLVWNPDGSNPTYRHESYAAAQAEAKRLALRHPGQEFYVLAADARVISETVKVEALTEPTSYGTTRSVSGEHF